MKSAMNKRKYRLSCHWCEKEFLGWRPTGKYCSKTCFDLAQRLSEEDFWPLVDRSPHVKGCWLWRGRAYDNGHGQYYGRFGSVFAHRYAYCLYYPDESLMSNDLICHSCDDGLCVVKEHLFKGTPYDNTHDALSKGRFVYGSRHPFATKTEDVVKHILADWKNGAMTQQGLATKYGVSCCTVIHIVQRTSWKHVTFDAG